MLFICNHFIYMTTFEKPRTENELNRIPMQDFTRIRRLKKCRMIQNNGDLVCSFFIFLTGIVGGGVQLGPLGTAATNRPIVPAPGVYDDGEIGVMIGRGNRSTRRKRGPVPVWSPQTSHALPGLSLQNVYPNVGLYTHFIFRTFFLSVFIEAIFTPPSRAIV
jgi:hypothetical protein